VCGAAAATQVYPGLQLPPGRGGRRIDPMNIPGVVEAGWRPQPLGFNLVRPDGIVVEPNMMNLGNFMREVIHRPRLPPRLAAPGRCPVSFRSHSP
jgi:hypothetical protein